MPAKAFKYKDWKILAGYVSASTNTLAAASRAVCVAASKAPAMEDEEDDARDAEKVRLGKIASFCFPDLNLIFRLFCSPDLLSSDSDDDRDVDERPVTKKARKEVATSSSSFQLDHPKQVWPVFNFHYH